MDRIGGFDSTSLTSGSPVGTLCGRTTARFGTKGHFTHHGGVTNDTRPGLDIDGGPRSDPLSRHAERLVTRLERLGELDRRIAWARLGWVVAAIPIVGLGWSIGEWQVGLATALALVVGFVIIVRRHRRLELSILRHRLRHDFVNAQVARRDVDWNALPTPLETSPDPTHPFADDLDLSGERSLLRLIDVAVSLPGSRRLFEWLSATETPKSEIMRRQAIARELELLPILRGRVALEAAMARAGERRVVPRRDERWESDRLARWLTEGPRKLRWNLERWTDFASVLAGLNIALFVGSQIGLAPPRIWLATFIPYVLILIFTVRAIGDPFSEAIALHGALEPLISLFSRIERFGCRRSPRLAELCAPIREGDHRPSRTLPRVSRLLGAASVRGNALLWLSLNAVVPWDLLVARALRRRRAEIAAHAPHWMNASYDLEALCGLANLADLREGTVWPFLRDDGPMLEAVGLGNPLLPERSMVRNDVTLGPIGEIMLITGSNMSGKSTFLRTLGVSTALALAGGPVVAHAWSARLSRLFTSLSIDDSVTDGISTFYAEVRRLRAMLDALERGEAAPDHAADPAARPLFFLVDELYRGTNNRERLAGSRALIHALVGRRAVGVVSTHDLDLVRLADELPSVRNAHFRDDVHDGRMSFDYTLRDGPCPTTNALRVMALGGLPAGEGDTT